VAAGLVAAGLEVVWRRLLHQRPNPQAFAVDGDVVLVVERSSRLVRVDPLTGDAIWETRVADTWGPLGIAGDRGCYVDERLGELRCFDLADGQQLWTAELPRPGGYAVGARHTVVTGGWRHYQPLTGFDLRTGRARWSFEVDGSSEEACLRPLAVDDELLVGSPGGRAVWQLDASTGRVARRWRLPRELMDADARAVFAPVGKRAALVRCGPRLVVRIDLDEAAAQTVWWHDADLEPDAVAVIDGLLILRETSGRTVAVDPVAGAVRWVQRLPEPAVADALAFADGYAVADRSGLLWILDAAGEPIARGPISRRHHLLAGTDDRLYLLGKGELICVAPAR
jgi:outer membrane protein assembly factor BamB